jgi:hypothetical protein
MPGRLNAVLAMRDPQIEFIRDGASADGSDRGSGERRHAGMIHEITLTRSDSFPNSLFETQSTFMSRPAVASKITCR